MLLWTVQFSPETIDYYNLQNAGLGADFMMEFENQVQQIMLNPFTRAVRYLNVRFALTERFPYAIHYIVKEDIHTIVVQTVLSTFKNPDVNWKKRKP